MRGQANGEQKRLVRGTAADRRGVKRTSSTVSTPIERGRVVAAAG